MASRIPTSALSFMFTVYRKLFPAVKKELAYWRNRAEEIPNEELRSQAIASIESKRFHCQGGAVYALLAGEKWREAIQFIVAYQTISDYLDNLCDRSTSHDPDDFRLLHQSMIDALSPENKTGNYYELREDQSDGDYLVDLVRTCQNTLRKLNNYPVVQDYLLKLECMYGELQVHKHVIKEERVLRLTNWHKTTIESGLSLPWYEYSAAAGSTLGIYCLVGYTLGGNTSKELASKIYNGYFPYMQGLHILLDYYIDQKEDELEAELNFCNYFPTKKTMEERIKFFIEQAHQGVQGLPNHLFHEMVYQGLVGLYLGDPKVKRLDGGKQMKQALLRKSGIKAKFFHLNTKMYYKIKSG
ncbi:tetraprenyl-beta-curcumene synthase family protein [Virgibacillus sp. C22-A2]|uniref:Tetraprenyl-beta-curcumene synthase family protein n=1 Tax=Virgibacillus tibetensis TaxID=3042313 RepID=A0ABU6KKF0_9BACI|nr:tetraprenyl-beta-curcumene synthase family protein [Virgibacillus sp. C22-A2]